MNINQPVELKISFIPGQEPQISGPLQDKMLCYAMLEVARDAIQSFNPEQQPLVAPAVLMPLRNGR
jgi:hypothetical protein